MVTPDRTAGTRGAVYGAWFPACGTFSLHVVDPVADAAVIHDWVSRPYARYWGMQDLDVAGVADAYRALVEGSDTAAYLGRLDGEPVFVLETYHPSAEPVGAHYPVRPGDRGMHILVAPPRRRIPGFTGHVFTLILDFLFSDPAVARIVVEPDVRNDAIHRLNRRAGFRYHGTIELPDKTACLAFCTRAQYRAARNGEHHP